MRPRRQQHLYNAPTMSHLIICKPRYTSADNNPTRRRRREGSTPSHASSMRYEESGDPSPPPTEQSNVQHRGDEVGSKNPHSPWPSTLCTYHGRVPWRACCTQHQQAGSDQYSPEEDDDLAAAVIDCALNRTHLVNAVAVQEQERNNSGWCRQEIRLEDLLDPHHHQGLTHPCLLLRRIQRPSGISMTLIPDDLATLIHLFAWTDRGWLAKRVHSENR